MTYKSYAQISSIESFLNSFVRDYEEDGCYSFQDGQLVIESREGKLTAEVKRNSKLYHHRYAGAFYLEGKKISFERFLELFAQEYCLSDQEKFITQVLESLNNIRNNLEGHPTLKIQNYLDSEKKLLCGHPFHPWPKLKKGMTPQEVHAYAPEFEGSFKLSWVYINSAIITGACWETPLKELQEFESIETMPGYTALPLHPWQWKKVEASPSLEKKDVLKCVEGKHLFSALSSMRSYYHPQSPWCLKSSLNIKLTNSLRALEVDEVQRGVELAKILKEEGIDARESALTLLKEPAYMCLKDSEGRVLKETLIQFRENFEAAQNTEQTFLLSALIERHPIEQVSKLGQIIKGLAHSEKQELLYAKKLWFSKFLRNVLSPLLELSLDKGVLLGAHLQNLILELDDKGLPLKVFYRDFQGSGFSKSLYEKLRSKYPENFKDKKVILDEQEIEKIFGYYLIVNTVFSVISALADSDPQEELHLLCDLRNEIWVKNTNSPHHFYNYLLHSEVLYQKGNMRCSLMQINETTDKEPWRIYSAIKNPLKPLRPVKLLHKENSPLYRAVTRRDNKISIRSLCIDDLDLFHRWHHQDYVKEFWELDLTKPEHLKHIQNLLDNPYEDPLIVEMNGEPFAYYQVYWAFEDRIAPYCAPEPYDRGLHLLIGEQNYLRTRHVYDSMLHVSQFLFEQHPQTQRIWAEPRSDNHKIMRFCERLPGWRFVKEFDFPHKRSALLRCERELFMKELKHAL